MCTFNLSDNLNNEFELYDFSESYSDFVYNHGYFPEEKNVCDLQDNSNDEDEFESSSDFVYNHGYLPIR